MVDRDQYSRDQNNRNPRAVSALAVAKSPRVLYKVFIPRSQPRPIAPNSLGVWPAQ